MNKRKKSPGKPPERVPESLRITCGDAGGIRLEAVASDDGEKPALRRFSMTAYTGGPMNLPGWSYPVVVDLAGLKVPKRSRPILKDHDRDQIVGHTDRISVTQNTLDVTGVISGAGAVARQIVASSENGFPWQASLGAKAQRVVFIPQGRTVEVNGREFSGPIHVAQKATLGEVSFVALGADDHTSARVAASADHATLEVIAMDETKTVANQNSSEFQAWAESNDLVLDGLDETNLASLVAMFKKQQAAAEPTGPPADAGDNEAPVSPAAEMRAQAAAESRRIAAVRKVCGGEFPQIEAQAIEEGWDETKTELAVLRASRPKAPAVGSSRPSCSTEILEAAACLSAGLDENGLVAQFGERTLEAAHPLRHIGLKELVAECARLEGMDIPRVFGDGTATIRAGFSTLSLPGILENVMNKTMLTAYQSTPIAAFDLASVSSVSDFKEVTRYRLLGTGGFEQVAPDGELKHGTLGEQKYTNRADTYGQILMLTRRDIINDDLNAFLDIPRQMGRSGAESIDDLFFSLLLSNPGSFFSTGNGNYLSGAATAFGSDSLTQAKTLFRKQKAGPGTKAKDQKPVNIRPAMLVVPVEIETDAELLMGASQLMIDGSSSATKIPVDNPHRNKYKVVSVPHLSDSYYTGASSKAWYLFADPKLVPAFELVFLNGRRTPIIERVEAPPNMLGMGFRGYIDVGVKEQDPRGATKVKGEA